MDRPISALFSAVADCAIAAKHPPGEYGEFAGPAGLRVKFNAGRAEREGVPPVHAAIYDGDWPLAVIHPFGGDLIRIGRWTEDKLIEAFQGHVSVASPASRDMTGEG